jgi:hypothetical protein
MIRARPEIAWSTQSAAEIVLWNARFIVMARLVRATPRGTLLVQVARTSRAMTAK